MPILEIIYTGALDDSVDRDIAKAVGKDADSKSYNTAARVRNIQFVFANDHLARAAKDKVTELRHYTTSFII